MSLASAALDLLHRRPGRKRLDRARRPDGKSDGERPQDIVAVAKAYRIKNGADPENALNMRYGDTIGQLRLEETISERQLYAAQKYRQCVISYWRLMGIPDPNPRTSDLLIGVKGHSTNGDIAEDVANEIKGRFRDCRRVLLETGRDMMVGSEINRVVYGVVVDNWPRCSVGTDHVQNLRCGLNALARMLQIS